MDAFVLQSRVKISSRICCSGGFFFFGSCYTMAEHAFVFGVPEKWKYSPFKVKKIETDFADVRECL